MEQDAVAKNDIDTFLKDIERSKYEVKFIFQEIWPTGYKDGTQYIYRIFYEKIDKKL